jgi:hypothetical protein
MSLKSEPLTVLLHFIFQRSSSSPKINVLFFSRFHSQSEKVFIVPRAQGAQATFLPG